MITLGLDIGSNSVGSAWIDTKKLEIRVGVSVFPAGVDETEDKRGAPKNQDRRGKRSLRRTLARRSKRKRETRQVLTEHELLPHDPEQLNGLLNMDPWQLRRRGIEESLSCHEFGRVLVHLGQRRGAVGFDADADDEGKVKAAMTYVQLAMLDKYGSNEARSNAKHLRDQIDNLRTKKKRTEQENKQLNQACEDMKGLCKSLLQDSAVSFGRFIADLMDERHHELSDERGNPKKSKKGNRSHYDDPIRNRLDSFEFHADRSMIRDEFLRLWKRQSEPDGALAHLSEKQREEVQKALDNPDRDSTWRHKGHLFGQRDTYWDTGTLGRCDLEPTDRCVPIADRHASYYRVLETVNNIRIKGPHDHEKRPLTPDERAQVIERLRTQKTGSVAAVRTALGIDKRSLKKQDIPEKAWSLSLEHDEDRDINTDWFHREIVLGAIGEQTWNNWPEARQEGLNRAVLKCDPANDADTERLSAVAKNLELDVEALKHLVEAWKTRPKLEKRLNLSRRAIINLLPYMEQQLSDDRWPTQIEARQMFAEDGDNGATVEHRRRYRLGAKALTKADRHFLNKHPNELPPAPMLSNPVVRKAIHEVRRHVIEHIRAHDGKKPDRIVIEFAREAKKPKKLSDWILNLNRKRDKIRKSIIEEVVKPAFGNRFPALSHNQLQRAVDRVVLARQQNHQCAYSGNQFGSITDFGAAKGDDLEIDHIIPRSRCGNNGWSNRVLCWQKSNQLKHKQTPREWWKSSFDDFIRPMAFMDGFEPAKGDPKEYFTKADYAAKWKNFNRENVPKTWRGSQLTDTAYAARQVQTYLQNALWSDAPSHLEGGQRRMFVTKGAYTHQLRKDWQLFQKIIDPSRDSREEVQEASAKDRGDHREHAVDAVAIAFIAQPGSVSKQSDDRPTTLIDDLAHYQQKIEEERLQAKLDGRNMRGLKRKPLPPPWGTVQSFRHQVMTMIYGESDQIGDDGQYNECNQSSQPIVVSHRPIGRRIIGAFHEDTLFGPVPDMEKTYAKREKIFDLKPAHLRLPEPEKKKNSIERLTQKYLKKKIEATKKKAKKKATALVESPAFTPPLVDPPPTKSGLIRDLRLRRVLRDQITKRQAELRHKLEQALAEETDDSKRKALENRLRTLDETIDLDSTGETATKKFQRQLKEILSDGPLCMDSGVPIKRVRLLRTHTNPVIVKRKKWDHQQKKWVRDTGKDGNLKPDQRSRADRAYVGGNNHHIEIRENKKGKWSGIMVTMFEAAKRVRTEKRDAVDRSDDDPEKGGRFIMSLAEGETVYMEHKDTGKVGYFVVFKLDPGKTPKIQFKHHWDARRAKGEKDDNGKVDPDSKREEMSVSAIQLRDLVPPGHNTPVKVCVKPLGEVIPLERD